MSSALSPSTSSGLKALLMVGSTRPSGSGMLRNITAECREEVYRMPQSKRRLNELIAKYPACGVIAAKHREGDGPYKHRPPTEIHVQRSDSNFLRFQADNIYPNDEDGLVPMNDPSLRATRYEYLVAVSHEHEIVGELRWPDSIPDKWKLYAKDIFEIVDPERISYLVWVIYQEWYENLGGKAPGHYFGKRLKPGLSLIVFEKPKGRSWQQAVDAHLFPPLNQPVLSGIERALREGCRLHSFTSGGGLRVIRIEQENKLRGYGEAPHVEEALNHADEDFLAGGREYSSVYGTNGKYTHYLTGSTHGTSNIDLWVRSGHTFDAWEEGDEIVFQLQGSTQYEMPDWVREVTEKNPNFTYHWQARGFTFSAVYSLNFFANGEPGHTIKVIHAPEGRSVHDAMYYNITKTGRGASFWEAMNAAFAAPEEEVIKLREN